MKRQQVPAIEPGDVPGQLPEDRIPKDVDLSDLPNIVGGFLAELKEESFVHGGIWRDWLSLTDTYRTIYGPHSIVEAWKELDSTKRLSAFKVGDATVRRLAPGTSWADVPFTFTAHDSNGLVGKCSGTAALTLDESSDWKIWTLRTMLEYFEGHGNPDIPLQVQANQSKNLNGVVNGTIHDTNGNGNGPLKFSAIIVGAGQNGLSTAGRLRALGISHVILEKNHEIGYNWTGKYDSVKQHTIREYGNLPFGRTWKPDDPNLLPARHVAEGFQNYVDRYGINVWLSTKLERCSWDEQSQQWTIEVFREGRGTEVIKGRHLMLALGAGVSMPKVPHWADNSKDKFKGQILHASQYKNSHAWKGKSAIIIGTGTTGHDIAGDMHEAGLSSITMIQRTKTSIYPIEWVVQGQQGLYNTDIPTSTADRINYTQPTKVLGQIAARNLRKRYTDESARFDALDRAGFKVDRDQNFPDQINKQYGGYYIDIGTSQKIVDGHIKVKSGVAPVEFTEHGLLFADGEEIRADIVIFATGYDHSYMKQVAAIVGEEIASNVDELWGVDAEGEIRGLHKPVGHPGLWFLAGTTIQAREFSLLSFLLCIVFQTGLVFWGENLFC